MLTKIKKLFSKGEESSSDNELKTNSSNRDKMLEKEINDTDPGKPIIEVKQAEHGKEEIVSTYLKDEANIVPQKTEKNSKNSIDVKSEPDTSTGNSENKNGQPHSIEEIKEEVIKVLKTCYDPEIPVDVWELGLIYDIKVATNGDVMIVMTLTSPSCPVAGILPGEIEQKVKDHPIVNDCKVQLTFDPPWGQKNMSEVAKLELGFL